MIKSVKKMKRFIGLFAAMAFICGHTFAQNHIARIDSLVTAWYNNHDLSGNILVAIHGKIIYKRSLGYANTAERILNNDSSTFQIASVSKTFTAVAILQLKEKGKLKLDDPVNKYLPDFPYGDITIRHLLSHTSGLTDFQIFEGPHRADTGKIFSNADIIPAIKADKQAILFKPGEKWSYSNPGFGLLALIVEKVSGMPFQDYMAKYVFKPAGMQHAYIATALLHVPDKNRTRNYDYLQYEPSRLKQVDSMPNYKIPHFILRGTMGNGNIITTAEDMLHFDRALYTSKLVKSETLQEAFIPYKLNNGSYDISGWNPKVKVIFGLGWEILADTSKGKIVFHNGGSPGAVTTFWRNITRDETVIILDNEMHREVRSAGIDILRLLDGEDVIPQKRSLAQVYAIALFKKGPDYAAARYNELKDDTAHFYMSEDALNDLGLHLLYDGHCTEALEALKLNTILYPASWNVYDSFGEALALAGKKEEAIAMYQKSVKMNGGNDGGKQALKRLMSQ